MYNNIIYFAVPKALVSKAIGPAAVNVKRMQEKLGKRIRIIQEPQGLQDAQRFASDIVDPIKFKSLELQDSQFVLTAGNGNKAALIGRNKRRLIELSNILKDNFGFDLRIM
jgi:transcription antitermination factor NusA-like protein